MKEWGNTSGMTWFTFLAFLAVSLLSFQGCGMAGHDLDRSVSSPPGEQPQARSLVRGLVGRITFPGGEPVEGAVVAVQSPEGIAGPPVPDMAIVSDPNGHYVWPLLPGRYEVMVRYRDRTAPGRVVTVREGEVTHEDFVLEIK